MADPIQPTNPESNTSSDAPPIPARNNTDISGMITSQPVSQPSAPQPISSTVPNPQAAQMDGMKPAVPEPPVSPETPGKPIPINTVNNQSVPPQQPPQSPPPSGFPMPSPIQTPQAPIAPPENKPGFKRILTIALVIIVVAVLIFAGYLYFKNRQPTTDETRIPTETPLPEEDQSDTTTAQGRDKIRKADLKVVAEGLSQYYQDNNQYPVATTLDKTNDLSGRLNKALVPKYMDKLPIDPLDPEKYYGYKSPTGQEFEITAALEVSSDPEGTSEGNLFLYRITNADISPSSKVPSTSPEQSSSSLTPPETPALEEPATETSASSATATSTTP